MSLKSLQSSLNAMFGYRRRPRKPRQPDIYRKDREWAKPVAAEYGIEIERMGPGWNVWPPKQLSGIESWEDPFEGDHYCQDWGEIRYRVSQYAEEAGRAPQK